MKKISQRHAKWMQKRINELERERSDQRNRWKSDWSPRWTSIDNIALSYETFARVSTARALGHAVVIVPDGDGQKVRLYAEKL